jgi:hypothetical protein
MRITDQLIFTAAKNTQTEGMIAINKQGSVFSINIDENNLVPFIMNQAKHIPNNQQFAFKLAQKHSLKGADDLFV